MVDHWYLYALISAGLRSRIGSVLIDVHVPLINHIQNMSEMYNRIYSSNVGITNYLLYMY